MSRRRAVTLALKGLVVLLVLAVLAGPPLLARYLEPVARDKAVELLERRFDDVRLEELAVRVLPSVSLVPRVVATGKGFAISLPDRPDAPPFITMETFEVELSALGLLRQPLRITRLRMDELEIQIPPGDGKDDEGNENEENRSGNEGKSPPPAILVETLEADGAVLRILSGNPENEPLEFVLHELEVDSAGLGEPMRFTTILSNAKPPGQIDAEGSFGPLDISHPGASLVSGSYVFENADLSVFGGIAGQLRSEGRFDGVLERIEVSGFTETPDFQLTSAGNPVDLRTDFHAIVDGTQGDTFLVPVDATIVGSPFHTEGGVSGRPGTEGKTVCVDAEGTEGRIEDFLRLAMKPAEPVMTGKLRFKSLVMIPPGEVDVARKLILDGEFAIAEARFPAREVQEKVDKLSAVGKGETGEKSGEGETREGDYLDSLRDERVFSDMRGTFELDGGVMTLSHVSFRVPGAAVTMRGTYGLVDKELDFRGELRLEAKLSETTTGVKSFLLKLVDPLFERDDAGAVIPIVVSGTPEEPKFGLDVTRTLTRQEVAAAPPPPGADGWTKEIPSCVALLELSPPDVPADGREAAAATRALSN